MSPENLDMLPIFVYGTLREGQKNFARFLGERLRRLEPAIIRGQLHICRDDGPYRYPCLIEGEGVVLGELAFPKEEEYARTLARIDRLEDYRRETDSGLYLRRTRQVETASGEKVQAWVYLWNVPGNLGPRIPGGDFTTSEYALKR